MEDLIQEIRVWNMAWATYGVEMGPKPLSKEDFIKKLDKKYTILKTEDCLRHPLLKKLEEKNDECNSYKLKLGEIQNVLNSKVKIVRQGKI